MVSHPPTLVDAAKRPDERPFLGRLTFFDGVLFNVADRCFDGFLVIQKYFPLPLRPHRRQLAVGAHVSTLWMERFFLELLRRLTLEEDGHLLDRVAVAANH